jgi:hypothetical protein
MLPDAKRLRFPFTIKVTHERFWWSFLELNSEKPEVDVVSTVQFSLKQHHHLTDGFAGFLHS